MDRGRRLGGGREGPFGRIFGKAAFRHSRILAGRGLRRRVVKSAAQRGRDMTKSRLMAGASGYSFKEWKGTFYPNDLKPDGMLAWYSTRLPTVEINNTFYR